MKVLGYIMLHYGADYLEYALHPLCNVCDKVVILYSLYPTHQGPQGKTCPEKRAELKAIADGFDNVEWVDVYKIKGEAEHLEQINPYKKGFDVAVRADYDEVWDEDDLREAIVRCYNSPFHAHGIDGFVHFWRNFNCELQPDHFRPIRLFHLRESNVSQEPEIKAKIYHFGYAIRRKTMEYKLTIHGHRAELENNWVQLWNNWIPEHREGYFHPASKDVWTKIVDFDRSKLPEFMREHPFYNKAII